MEKSQTKEKNDVREKKKKSIFSKVKAFASKKSK